jgi:Zn-dependent peptidase ImmA (M78 family)
MQYGFKARAEKLAAAARAMVGLPEDSPLPARKLAKAMGAIVVGPRDIPAIPETLARQMLFDFAKNWSGITLPVDGQTIIILNTTHIPARQESDIMHELAHILCEHKPARIDPPGKLPWASRSFDPEQEAQAAWLGGCLQITKAGVYSSIAQSLDNLQIAERYGASPEMVRFRRNMSGVDQQSARRARYRGAVVVRR